LKPEGLEVLSEKRNPVLLGICMLVMLLNVKVYVLVKVEVLATPFIPSYLKDCSLVTMALPVDKTHCPPRRRVCRVLYTCHPFLVLLNFFTWLHQLDFPQQA
jgi:hypothetical protein